MEGRAIRSSYRLILILFGKMSGLPALEQVTTEKVSKPIVLAASAYSCRLGKR